jgi:transposase-like protein
MKIDSSPTPPPGNQRHLPSGYSRRAPRAPDGRQIATAIDLYRQGCSGADIGAQMGLSSETVLKMLRRVGITARRD